MNLRKHVAKLAATSIGGPMAAQLVEAIMREPDEEAGEALIDMDILAEHEGSEGMPYDCPLGYPTIGIGCRLPLDREEQEMIAAHRFGKKVDELRGRIPWFDRAPLPVRKGLSMMAFQLGTAGVMGFPSMLAALEVGNYEEACRQAGENGRGGPSRWMVQTPTRVKYVQKLFRSVR